MTGESVWSDQSQGSLKAGLRPRNPGHLVAWEEEGKLSGSRLVGITRMEGVHFGVSAVTSSQAGGEGREWIVLFL